MPDRSAWTGSCAWLAEEARHFRYRDAYARTPLGHNYGTAIGLWSMCEKNMTTSWRDMALVRRVRWRRAGWTPRPDPAQVAQRNARRAAVPPGILDIILAS